MVRYKITFFTILILSIILRIVYLDKLSFWQDELFSTRYLNIGIEKIIPYIFQTELNMGLFYFLLNLWAKFINYNSEFNLRLLPVFFSVVAVPFVYLIGSSLLKDRKKSIIIGILSSFLISINSFNVQYAQELRAYSLVTLLTLVSTYLLIKFGENKSLKYVFIYTIINILSIYAHFFALLVILSHAISILFYLIFYNEKFPWKTILASYLITILCILPVYYFVNSNSNNSLNWIQKINAKTLINFLNKIIGNNGLLYTSIYIFGFLSSTILVKNLIFKYKSNLEKLKIILIFNLCFIPLLITCLVSFVKPLFVDRYLIFVMPYMIIYFSLGLSYLYKQNKKIIDNKLFIAVMIVIIILSALGLTNYYLNYKKEDYRGISNYMVNNCHDSLKLFYPQWIKDHGYLSYYDSRIISDFPTWYKLLYSDNFDINFKNVRDAVQSENRESLKVCLMIGYLSPITNKEMNEIKVIKSAIKDLYPLEKEIPFYNLNLYIYER